MRVVEKRVKKAIHVTDRGGLEDCEMSTTPQTARRRRLSVFYAGPA
jgi:hypothetical protein